MLSGWPLPHTGMQNMGVFLGEINHYFQPPKPTTPTELQRTLLVSPKPIPMCPRYAPAEAVYVPAAGAVSAFAGLRVAQQKCVASGSAASSSPRLFSQTRGLRAAQGADVTLRLRPLRPRLISFQTRL